MSSRSALVTGGSSGIGLAIAEALVEDGWSVTLVGRSPDRLEEAGKSLPAPGAVHTIAADLSKDESARVVAEHVDLHGRLDLLVNNAGVGFVGPISDKSQKVLDLELSLNLRSSFRLLQESLPALRAAARSEGTSYVVNMSSVTALETPPYATIYAATKAALVAMSRSAHAELSPEGISVTAIVPGFVETAGTSWVSEDKAPSMLLPADVAEAVRFVLRTSSRCFVPEIHLTQAGAGSHEIVDWKSFA